MQRIDKIFRPYLLNFSNVIFLTTTSLLKKAFLKVVQSSLFLSLSHQDVLSESLKHGTLVCTRSLALYVLL